jgi:hypothetical protein
LPSSSTAQHDRGNGHYVNCQNHIDINEAKKLVHALVLGHCGMFPFHSSSRNNAVQQQLQSNSSYLLWNFGIAFGLVPFCISTFYIFMHYNFFTRCNYDEGRWEEFFATGLFLIPA